MWIPADPAILAIMTNEEKIELKNLILTKIRDIEESYPYLVEETRAIEPSSSLGRLTRMEAISEKGINEYVLAKNRQNLQKMYNALDRMEKGSYGTCLKCGREIPLGRLSLVPEAVLCVSCSSSNRQ
ncbi:MAG: TraR/DksA family transcriptional regulator [Sediminispirochaetaceae bacterium]